MKPLLITALLAIALLGVDSPQPAATPQASASPAPIVIHMTGFAFDPDTVTIAAGQTIEWINDDDVQHSATAMDHTWDSGELTKGQSWTRTFPTAGTYRYYCDDHVFMKAKIVVK